MKMFLQIWTSDIGRDNPVFYLSNEAPGKGEYRTSLGEVDVTFDMPPMPTKQDLINNKINFLRSGREEVVKEFSTKLANIDDQLNKLLALPSLREGDND